MRQVLLVIRKCGEHIELGEHEFDRRNYVTGSQLRVPVEVIDLVDNVLSVLIVVDHDVLAGLEHIRYNSGVDFLLLALLLLQALGQHQIGYCEVLRGGVAHDIESAHESQNLRELSP